MGKKSPPKQPDYTADRNAFAQSEFAKRQQEAAAYNASVAAYNDAFGSFNNQLNSLGSQVRGLTIVDDEKFGSLADSIRALQSQAQGYTGNYSTNYTLPGSTTYTPNQMGMMQSVAGIGGEGWGVDKQPAFNEHITPATSGTWTGNALTRPTWESTVNSPYGAVSVGMPTLSSVNSQLQNSFYSQSSQLLGLIDSLTQQRKAEEKRIDDYANQFRQSSSGFSSTLDGLKLNNQSSIDAAKQQLAQMQAASKGFSSSILGEYNPLGAGYIDTTLGGFSTRLTGIQGSRDAELAKVKAYEDELNSTYDTLASRFGGLDISKLSDLEDIQRQIDQRQLNATRYAAPVEFDLSQEITPYGDLEMQVQRMLADRRAEEARIKGAYEEADQNIYSLASQIGSSGIYNGTQLNQLNSNIDQARNKLSGFSSLLDFNFQPYMDRLNTADADLDGLLEQRRTALEGFGSKITGLRDSYSGREAYDLAGFQDEQTRLNDLYSQLGAFTGNDVRAYTDMATGLRSDLNTAVSNVYSTRNSIENEAKGLLSDVENSSFYTAADIDAKNEMLKALRTRSDQWGGNQTADEFASINSIFSKNRERLTAEAQAAADREAAEREAMAAQMKNPYSMYAQQMGMSPEDYMAFLASWSRRPANQNTPNTPSAFSQQLGIIYA